MVVALPAEVARGFMHGFRYVAEVSGDVVLEALAADVPEQFLQLGNLGHACAADFVTAHDSPAMRQEAQQAGCSAFFPKPVPTKLLLEAINQAVNPGGDDSQHGRHRGSHRPPPETIIAHPSNHP